MASLEEYRRKRRFQNTPEPSGSRPGKAAGNRFVVQKHDATRLHYDFRLEIDGVLKSWAIPKGPSMNPGDKRLAMQTEDHPLDYIDFEGRIPEGQYGAGPVIVWDRGRFKAEGTVPAGKQLEKGELKFVLYGQKLKGSFVLVRMRRRDEKARPWLLIKHKDAAVDLHWNIEAHDGSVLSGRTLQDIEEASPPPEPAAVDDPTQLERSRKAAMPPSVRPMLATLIRKPFSGPGWLFEIKWDGIRAMARVRDDRLELRSRTGRLITASYPELKTLPQRLRARKAILDGEIVALDEKGRSDFERLQSRLNVHQPPRELVRRVPVTYYLFDILYCDGYDLRDVPLIERKNFLRRILEPAPPFAYSDHQMAKGKELFELARQRGLEGIIGKQVRSDYTEGRSPNWVKFKITRTLDAVIGGYTAPRGSREHFGALLLGLYQCGQLYFIGGVGTGFDHESQKLIHRRLKRLRATRCPFDTVPQTAEKAEWVKPAAVARVKFGNWTRERRLRAPVFLGLAADHRPAECRFEISDWPPGASRPTGKQAAHEVRTRQGATVASASWRLSGKQGEKELLHGRAENPVIEIDGKRLRLTNLNKPYFPESAYTKRDLLAYYYRMAEYILPFLRDRPLVLRRYPNGITGKSFFQKEAGEAAPDWMETVAIPSQESRKEIRYFLANDRAALLYLTNLGCIDHNPWASRRDDLEHPDYVFFDLDPSPGTAFDTVVAVGQLIRQKLHDLGLRVFLKTSGATGLHLYVPLQREYSYRQTRMFAEIIGRLTAIQQPQWITQQRSIAKRRVGTVLIDAYQNAPDRPLAAVYSVRAFPGAPVSAPIAAAELKKGLRPERLHIRSIFERLKTQGDLWASFWATRQRLEEAVKKIERQ